MLGDPELEERQRRWNEWRLWVLETLHRQIPYRVVGIAEGAFMVRVRRLKSVRVRNRLLSSAATYDRGTCSLCSAIILIPPFTMPAEPLRVCLQCAKRNLRGGDLLFVDPTPDAPPPHRMKLARKRRPRTLDGR
jgi:hypothetical protein